MRKKFVSKVDKFDGNLWGHHLVIPADIAKAFLEADSKRVVCDINGAHQFQCAIMPNGQDYFFININKDIRTRLGLKPGMEVTLELEKDASEYGLPVPEEFSELLALDEEGSRLFHALTPGKQRSLIHIVGTAKRSETRIHKALAIVDHLKANNGKLDFKLLMERMKEP